MCGGFASANSESSAATQRLQRELQQRQGSNAAAAEATGAHGEEHDLVIEPEMNEVQKVWIVQQRWVYKSTSCINQYTRHIISIVLYVNCVI